MIDNRPAFREEGWNAGRALERRRRVLEVLAGLRMVLEPREPPTELQGARYPSRLFPRRVFEDPGDLLDKLLGGVRFLREFDG